MKVRDLKERLSKLDPQLDVYCMTEDEKFLSAGRLFVVFDVVDVSTTEAEPTRLDDDTPYLKFGKGSPAITIATLQITSDF